MARCPLRTLGTLARRPPRIVPLVGMVVGNPHKPLTRKLALAQHSKLGQLVALVGHIELEQLELVERIALALGIELVGQCTPQLGPSRLALDRLERLVALGPDRLEQLVALELDKLGQLAVLVELGTLAVVVEQLAVVELEELDKPVVAEQLVAALELGIAVVELAALIV